MSAERQLKAAFSCRAVRRSGDPMSNDIVGAPELFVIKARLFAFSPLNDFELSQLKAWVDWRAETKVEQYSDVYFLHLATVAGAAQLLSISCRVKPISVEDAAAIIANDLETAIAVNDFWFKLNFIDVDYPKVSIGNPDKSQPKQKNSQKDIYTVLSKAYKWTPQQISMLTPYQQYVYAMATVRMPVFATQAEYFQWLNSK